MKAANIEEELTLEIQTLNEKVNLLQGLLCYVAINTPEHILEAMRVDNSNLNHWYKCKQKRESAKRHEERESKKKFALAKLTKEEIEILGLNK